MKEYNIKLDLKLNNSVELAGLVNGDTGNLFIFQITQDGIPYKLSDDNNVNYRLRLLISNKQGISSEDTASSEAFTFLDSLNGKIAVEVYKGMIADGYNHGRIEIYEDDNTLITTQPFNFEARSTYIVEKSPEFPSLIQIEQEMLDALSQMSSIASAYVSDNGHLHIVLDNGNDVDLGEVEYQTDSVHYSEDVKTAEQKAQARTNIGASASDHVHGNLSNDGKVGSPSSLVETNSSGNLVANRKLVVGTASPSEVTGLAEGDIYIRRSPNVDRTFEGNVNVAGNVVAGGYLQIGDTVLTEDQLIALLGG